MLFEHRSIHLQPDLVVHTRTPHHLQLDLLFVALRAAPAYGARRFLISLPFDGNDQSFPIILDQI